MDNKEMFFSEVKEILGNAQNLKFQSKEDELNFWCDFSEEIAAAFDCGE